MEKFGCICARISGSQGPGSIRANWMIGSLIEDQFKGAAGNWPFGAAASMILLSMVLLVLIFYARRQSRAEEA